MIPITERRQDSDLGPYITWSQIQKYHTPAECEAFSQFMVGQTCGVTASGEYAIYNHDYDRWLAEGRKASQDPRNWD